MLLVGSRYDGSIGAVVAPRGYVMVIFTRDELLVKTTEEIRSAFGLSESGPLRSDDGLIDWRRPGATVVLANPNADTVVSGPVIGPDDTTEEDDIF